MVGKAKVPSSPTAPDGIGREGNGVTAHELGRERVIDIQRARVLAAMVEECAERGAGNVTVAHVVARAGVSRRTFYELFSDREDCFLGAFDDGVARASRYVLNAYDPNARWVERVRSALTSLLSFLDVERELGQLLIIGSLGAGQDALRRRRRGIAQIIAFIGEGATLTGTPHRVQAGKSAKASTELPPLTAEGIVGGVLSVLHARLLEDSGEPLIELTGPLMSMIVLPYLGPAAARRELARPVPKCPAGAHRAEGNPLGELEMRLTYRTVRVLMAIAALGGRGPGPSNRAIADAAEVTDQGQMSKLLARLHAIGLIENTGGGASRGEPNAWTLTDRGWRVQGAIAEQTSGE